MVSVQLAQSPSGDDLDLNQILTDLNEADAERVRTAHAFASNHLPAIQLDTGEPPHAHLFAVARLLTDLKTDGDTRIAAILAPVVYYAKIPEQQIRQLFGSDISVMTASLSQLLKLRAVMAAGAESEGASTAAIWAAQTETLRKMLLGLASDIRVVLIRLCSRLQTLRYFSGLQAVKDQSGPRWLQAQLHAREALDLYAPLANRLGVWQVKWEMEDLALRLLQPETYRRIAKMLDEKRTEREKFISDAVQTLADRLLAARVSAEISGRPKHIYSIWNKMRGKQISFDKLYDVRACRIIVKDVKDCYTALGIVHDIWTPLPEEFDDYIAKPKANGYQSLHTVVRDDQGRTLEVQIRTQEMHKFAEYGVAAHWRYKESGTAGYDGQSRAEGDFDEKIAFLRQLLAWKDEVRGTIAEPSTWAHKLKETSLDDQVYVFTPQGRIIELPKGSTPVDMAYHIHTDLGHKCRGARINGAMVPLNTALKSSQTVEIITVRGDAPVGPSRDWLNPQLGYMASPRAKTKVRQWFAQQELKDTIEKGRSIAERELQRIGQTAVQQELLASKMGFADAEALYIALARDEIRPRAIEHALNPSEPSNDSEEEDALKILQRKKKSDGSQPSGVLVVGVDALLTQLARCCRPTPPDPIVGYVTRGKGISIHRIGCPNLASVARQQPERLIETTWGENNERKYPVDILVQANDRQGLLRDVTEVFSREKINVIGVNTQSQKGTAKMQFTAEVGDSAQMQRALNLLLDVNGVFEARRR